MPRRGRYMRAARATGRQLGFRGRRLGRFRRRFRRRFGHACPAARSLKKVELRSLHWKNQTITTISPVVVPGGAFSSALITDIAEGVQQTERTGDRVSIHSIIMSLHAKNTTTSVSSFLTMTARAGDIRFWVGIIMAKTNVSTPPVISDIFQTGIDTPGMQVRNLNEIRDWKIVWQRNVKLSTIGIYQNQVTTVTDAFKISNRSWMRRFRVPLRNHAVRFASATSTDGRVGNLFLCAYSHQAASVDLAYAWRMRWTG